MAANIGPPDICAEQNHLELHAKYFAACKNQTHRAVSCRAMSALPEPPLYLPIFTDFRPLYNTKAAPKRTLGRPVTTLQSRYTISRLQSPHKHAVLIGFLEPSTG